MAVPHGYAAVLRVTGARQFLFGSAIERLGGAMFGVAVVAMVSARTGSYSLAGAVSAGALVVLAITAAVIGRLVDRYGQRRVTLPLVVWSTLWSVGVVAVSILGAPSWTLFVTYAMSAVVGTTGTLSRARWSHLLEDRPGMLHTAMSLEQVIDELAFVGGPALAVVLATTVLPEAGYIAAATLFLVGALVFLARTDTEPPVDRVTHKSTTSVLRNPGVLVVCAVSFMLGAIFGSNEIVTIATAAELGHKGASGLILAVYALASAVAGVVYGAREDAVPAHRALWIGALAMCVLEAPVLLVDSIPLLALVLTLAGFATAPTLIVTMKLAGSLVPGNQVTESMGMIFTALVIGIAAGSALGGIVVQGVGGHAGYVVPVAAAGLGAVLGLVFNRRLR
ncbi:MFS transporter [Allobranchiibius sp. CTAmp26]|uniref:MFS transporter n=1 Tax=Allobranchiibius sp. CTAmp26 TaxID=2815214 RepID=UPI001AA15B60|nr:MFS transporter [Allobranchiibius sp. CTAmp26]MBO1754793.1 MFS transporter [Allobranchiibius sp. CTAmp26]